MRFLYWRLEVHEMDLGRVTRERESPSSTYRLVCIYMVARYMNDGIYICPYKHTMCKRYMHNNSLVLTSNKSRIPRTGTRFAGRASFCIFLLSRADRNKQIVRRTKRKSIDQPPCQCLCVRSVCT